MMNTIRLEQFEGPLELLLNLIEVKKLAITDISLAEVTDHYLKALEAGEKWLGPEELADFLVIASRLLLIKSRVLLPIFEWDDEEESLSSQLRMYKLYADAAEVIQNMIRQRMPSFGRAKILNTYEMVFSPPPVLTVVGLKKIMIEIISELEPLQKIPEKVYRRVLSLQEKIHRISALIKKRRCMNFSTLLSGTSNRADVVVSFLALLELIKQQEVCVRQSKNFMEIEIVLV